MEIVILGIKLALALAIGTEIGFLIQRTYIDIRLLAISSVMAVTVALVTLAYPIVDVLATVTIFLYLLTKDTEIPLSPDAILAAIVGFAFVAILILEKVINVSCILWFYKKQLKKISYNQVIFM